MALTDEEVRDLQEIIKKESSTKEGGIITDKVGRSYQVVNSIDETTQALAVVPVDNSKGDNPDYSQTAIVVAGTQPGLNESTKNAVEASGVFGLTDGQLTAQTETIDQFYQETVKKLEVHNGTVSNMSGFSQSGPGVAKVGAKYQVPKITNFTDWAAAQAVKSG
ncbi:hypothetical protein AB3329_10810, partial [Streptococcus sp. H31]